MKNIRVSLSIILMITGFIVIFSYHYFNKNKDAPSKLSTEQWDREHQLRGQLIKEQETNRILQGRLSKDKQKIQSIEQKLARQKNDVADLANELTGYRMLNGYTKVHGPGVKVTLKDADYAPDDEDPNNYIVHQQDLQEVIYELYAAGAEAIALNTQRLSSHSYIQCVGPVVKIDGHKSTAPFTVEAIGNSELLSDSLKMNGGTVDLLTARGINISVEKNPTSL